MANYLQLKQQFNSNKKFIKQVLNNQKCQLRLQAEGLSTLNNLINQTTQIITSLPTFDNFEYSYIHSGIHQRLKKEDMVQDNLSNKKYKDPFKR